MVRRNVGKGAKSPTSSSEKYHPKSAVSDLVFVVGCGGVFFHGLTQLSTWARRRGKTRFILMDEDKIEEKNRLRQWPHPCDKNKAVVASDTLGNVFGLVSYPVKRFLEEKHDLSLVLKNKKHDYLRCGRIWVVSSPDNHLARMLAHQAAQILSEEKKCPVVSLTGGNDEKGGYAYATTWLGGKTELDWLLRHDDIISEAELEIERKAHPMGCGQLEQEPEQTVIGNVMTASCMWGLAEHVARERDVIEMNWTKDDVGRVQMTERKNMVYASVLQDHLLAPDPVTKGGAE